MGPRVAGSIPGEGSFFCDADSLETLEANDQILFRYVDSEGDATDHANPNGSLANIAGITNAAGNVIGLMPHPEHAVEPAIGGTDGLVLLGSLVDAVGGGST